MSNWLSQRAIQAEATLRDLPEKFLSPTGRRLLDLIDERVNSMEEMQCAEICRENPDACVLYDPRVEIGEQVVCVGRKWKLTNEGWNLEPMTSKPATP